MFYQPKSYRKAIPASALRDTAPQVASELAPVSECKTACANNDRVDMPSDGRLHPFALFGRDDDGDNDDGPARTIHCLPTPLGRFPAPPLPIRSSSFRTPPPSRSQHLSHSTTPSFASISSASTTASSWTSASARSLDSDSLVTPVKSYLHPSAGSPPSVGRAFDVKAKPAAPTRPLPPTPDSPRGESPQRPHPTRSTTWSVGCRARSRSPFLAGRRSPLPAPPPLPDIAFYASMPLPPVPKGSRSESIVCHTLDALSFTGRSKRDSQATVRASDFRPGVRDYRETIKARSCPTLPDTLSDTAIIVHQRRGGYFDGPDDPMEDVKGDLEQLNFGDFQLDAFPLPPTRSFTPSPTPTRSSSMSRGPHRPAIPAGLRASIDRPVRSNSVRVSGSRKAPPPPLPALNFDIFSLERERPGRLKPGGGR